MNYIIELAIGIAICIMIFIVFKLIKKPMKVAGIIATIMLIMTLGYVGFEFYNEKPEIILQEGEHVKLEVNQQYEEKGAKASYHFKDITDKIKEKKDIDTTKLGKYTVQYEVTYDNKTTVVEKIVEVVDSTLPEIILEGEASVYATTIDLYKESGFKATDNYDGDVTEKVVIDTQKIEENLYKKIYQVSDNSGNTCKVERNVEIKDIVPPEITLNGNQTQTIYKGGVYDEKGATAVDDLDGDISKNIEISGKVDASKIGTYEITYTVTDSNGNKNSKTRKIRVEEIPVNGTGVVYLTFDDGPSASITPKMLDILKSENVKATFFILNYSDSNEYLVKRIVNEGHTIAIHGYSHSYGQIYASEEAYMNNLKTLKDKIKASTGVDTIITRFPGGSSNTVSKFNPGIMTRLVEKVVDEGYRYFDWNVSSGDAGDVSTSQGVYNNVTKILSHKRENVVLMHDFSGNTKTLNALRDIIQYCKNNGYKLDRITNATPMVTHRVNN